MPASHLNWPFFQQRHGDRQRKLDAWCGEQSWEQEPSAAELDASCRDITARLGEEILATCRDLGELADEELGLSA